MSEGRKAQRTILLIEEDDETRKVMVGNLRRDGYRVLVALDEESALTLADGGGVAADLYLVNLVGGTAEEALAAGRRVRERAGRDGQTPLVVIPERYGKDLEGTNVNVAGNDWVLYLGDESDQLRNLLARLTA